jgi:hypothetical protein
MRHLKIDIDMTFDEWYAWWDATGHFDERGPAKDQYCMSRIDITQPYSTTNIECILNTVKHDKNRKLKGLGIISPTATYDTLLEASVGEHRRRKTIKEFITAGVPGWSYK